MSSPQRKQAETRRSEEFGIGNVYLKNSEREKMKIYIEENIKYQEYISSKN